MNTQVTNRLALADVIRSCDRIGALTTDMRWHLAARAFDQFRHADAFGTYTDGKPVSAPDSETVPAFLTAVGRAWREGAVFGPLTRLALCLALIDAADLVHSLDNHAGRVAARVAMSGAPVSREAAEMIRAAFVGVAA